MDSRRRSQIVGLTLVGLPLGAVALASIIPAERAVRRNLYTDRAACERDYRAEQCAQRTSTSSGSPGYGYHGPYYGGYAGRGTTALATTALAKGDPGAGRTGQISPTEASTRGGFGSFGRAMHSIGAGS
jgi:hypothetical protein